MEFPLPPAELPDPLDVLEYAVELDDARSLLELMPYVDGAHEAVLALDRVLAGIEGGVEPQ